MRTNGGNIERLEDLRLRREQLRKRTALLVQTFDEETLADAKEELDRMKTERQTLDEQIASIARVQKMESQNPEAVVENVIQRLKQWGEELPSMAAFPSRQVLGNLLISVVGDMETKEVEVQFALPSWVVWESKNAEKAMCLEPNSGSPISFETHQQNAVELGMARCSFRLVRSKTTCNCRRIRKAA
jgi:hypothetical protein